MTVVNETMIYNFSKNVHKKERDFKATFLIIGPLSETGALMVLGILIHLMALVLCSAL